MQIDLISAVIFGLFAILVFNKSFTIKTTILIGVSATILTHALIKIYALLPYVLFDKSYNAPLLDHHELTIILLQLPVNIFILLMIRKDDDNLFRFTIFAVIGIFISYMLIPFLFLV